MSRNSNKEFLGLALACVIMVSGCWWSLQSNPLLLSFAFHVITSYVSNLVPSFRSSCHIHVGLK